MTSERRSIAEIRGRRATQVDYYSEELVEIAPAPGLLAHFRDSGTLGAADPFNSRSDVKGPHSGRSSPTSATLATPRSLGLVTGGHGRQARQLGV